MVNTVFHNITMATLLLIQTICVSLKPVHESFCILYVKYGLEKQDSLK